MLQRIQTRIASFIKKAVTMSESLPETMKLPDAESDKQPLEGGLSEEPPQKKSKQEHLPAMKGRVDRKRKVALLLAYCGKGYYGIQRNPPFNTIEEELHKALLKCELITQDSFDSPHKMSFQRAARTDKGVSAVSNLVSLKMLINRDNLEDTINEQLPSQIRVIAHRRVTKSFDSKTQCGGRTYAYMTPTYAFAPLEKFVTEEYRTTPEIIATVNRLLAIFKGTHNFHNFTSGIKFNEPKAFRYMISFECSEPFVTDGLEFVIMRVKGQSFMLHHIRKMVGLMIAVLRGYCSEDCFQKAWLSAKLDIPRAPGLGLMLEELHYDGYNNRFGKDGMHESIEWSQYKDVLETFKKEHIISHIVASEKEEKTMLTWLGTLQFHRFDMKDSDEKPWWPMKKKLSQESKAREDVLKDGQADISEQTADDSCPRSVDSANGNPGGTDGNCPPTTGDCSDGNTAGLDENSLCTTGSVEGKTDGNVQNELTGKKTELPLQDVPNQDKSDKIAAKNL